MIHDIAHCEGINCQSKESCYRYKAHLEAIDRKLDYLTYLVLDSNKEYDKENCQSYWSINYRHEKGL